MDADYLTKGLVRAKFKVNRFQTQGWWQNKGTTIYTYYIFTYFQKRLQVISNNNVKRRVEIMRSTGLHELNRRLQLRNPKVQYCMSWFTAHEIGLRSNLWLSILFIHSHFVEINRRFTRCSFICYMLILNNISSIWTTDVYLPDKRCVNLIYMLIQSWSEKQVLV